jgi:hypothetical protein
VQHPERARRFADELGVEACYHAHMMHRPPPAVGPLVAIGFILVAAFRLLFAFCVVMPDSTLSLAARLPGLGAIVGGILIAMGWGRAIANPRADLRAIGVLGTIGGVGIAMFGFLSLISSWLLFQWHTGFLAWSWVELAVGAMTLAGAKLWHLNRPTSPWIYAAAITLGAHAIGTFSDADSDSETRFLIVAGAIPAAAWALTAIAALAMRAVQPIGPPTAVVVQR